MKTRLYKVTTPTGVRLIESPSPQRAIAHVARSEIKAEIPAQHEVYSLATKGIPIESVTDEPVSDETRSKVAQVDLVAEAA